MECQSCNTKIPDTDYCSKQGQYYCVGCDRWQVGDHAYKGIKTSDEVLEEIAREAKA